jgi:precorrin-4/cobalt-precorrin-4 C11-methyltransferase
LEGRTSVPEKEKLELLAQHNCSMVIFLSVHMIENVVDKLLSHYKKETPVAVVQKISCKDQKIVLGTLADISKKVKEQNITKTALILVGDFLGDKYERSKLYSKFFSHKFRKVGGECGG